MTSQARELEKAHAREIEKVENLILDLCDSGLVSEDDPIIHAFYGLRGDMHKTQDLIFHLLARVRGAENAAVRHRT